MNKPLVSIIIPTYNSEKTLGTCLESIRKQTYRNIEIIIIDRFSRDKTIEIAKKFGANIKLKDCERTEAKNIGVKEAQGKYVCFIDSDMELSKEVVEECVHLMESNENIGGVIIPEITSGDSFWARVRAYERKFYIGTDIESPRFFRKDLVLRVNGFDEDIVFFEEKTLEMKINKLGFQTRARINSRIIHNENNFSLKRWIRKKYQYGKTFFKYVKRYKNCAKTQVNPFSRLNIFLFNECFYENPIYAFSLLILKLLEYISVLLGSIIQ